LEKWQFGANRTLPGDGGTETQQTGHTLWPEPKVEFERSSVRVGVGKAQMQENLILLRAIFGIMVVTVVK